MNIKIETGIYNEKRYGKPWIARVDFKTNKKGDFSFGDWIGDPGYCGLLELENINVGDIVARGQRDARKASNSAPDYYIVLEDGKLDQISKVEAYKLSTKNEG